MKVTARLENSQTIWFNKRLNETHKTQTELLKQIIGAYIDFEKAGYLGEDGNKIRDLETQLQLKEKLRQVEANRLQDRLDYQKELDKMKKQAEKERAIERSLRHQPRVDWGDAKGTYVEGGAFELGDR